jgi:hypothetical protein
MTFGAEKLDKSIKKAILEQRTQPISSNTERRLHFDNFES